MQKKSNIIPISAHKEFRKAADQRDMDAMWLFDYLPEDWDDERKAEVVALYFPDDNPEPPEAA